MPRIDPDSEQPDLTQRVRVVDGKPGGKFGSLDIDPKFSLPTREQVAQLAIDAYRLALDNTMEYETKRGSMVRTKRPDFIGACHALKVLMQVSGHTGVGRPRIDAEASAGKNADDVKKELASKDDDEVSKEELRIVTEEQLRAEKEQRELTAEAALEALRSRNAKDEYGK